ncbi:MAG: transcriptional regulator ArsR family [Ignavibacteria bacterium]|nr:MAG: transcriptional regulator ArsR family [Ignavibacteria bacterium]KAF0157167.1 MAG: transcriptional regulator ArsR family [Ignavibacteria bacterium]
MSDKGIMVAKSKTEKFTQEESRLADIAKALSHPARIKILKILAEMNVCMCGEIVELLPLAQATVSQHLKELKRVRLIQGEIEGPKTCYCINTDSIIEAYKQLQNYFEAINKECKRTCKTNKK